MTALIADTSPIFRKIPSDPAVDRRERAFGFSQSPSPMSVARYPAEGRHQAEQHHRQQSPNPRSYGAHHAPAPYARSYSYAVPDAFPSEDTGAPARIPHKACRCQQQQQRSCSCSTGPKTAQSTPASSMWRKDRNADNSSAAPGGVSTRPGLFPREPSRSGAQRPPPVRVSAPSSRREAAETPALHPRQSSKKSDWENLLGAVDLELRAQRAERVPEAALNRISPSSGGFRPPLHPSAGDNRYRPSASSSASSSPELGPYKPTHRRGGDGAAGGEPAYSGSTADAACLLATLPQRMLDRVSMTSGTAGPPAASKPPAVAVSSPALVPAMGPAPGQPARVQASGRRGPRGQSRFKGVCITRAGKWRAVIYIGRKQKYLGVFDSEFDAARAYDASALQHFAEGAKLNFPDGIEQQLRDLSNGGSVPFSTAGAGAGGAAAARSATPPAMDSEEDQGSARKRSRKSTFGDDDDEWVREGGPWNPSRR